MTDKTLTIKIHTDLGDSITAQQTLESAIKNTGAALKDVSTIAKNSFTADGWKTEYSHIIKLTGAVQDLAKAENAIKGVSAVSNTTATTKTPSIAADLTSQFKQEAAIAAKALKDRLNTEQALRQNSGNTILASQRTAADNEKAIHTKLAADILAIEHNLATGVIIDLTTATQQRIALERTAARDITALRRSVETQQTRAVARTDSAAVYRRETQEIQTELQRRLALEQSIRINGANNVQTLAIRTAQEEARIMQNASRQILAIEQQLQAGIIQNRGAANAMRTAILSRTEAQINSNRVVLEAAQLEQRNADATTRAANAHRNMVIRAAEFIGIYQVLNGVLNQVLTAIRAIPKVGIEMESTLASLSATVNGAEFGASGGTGSVFKALTEEARRTGIEISTIRENFRTFQASASLAGESLKDVWTMFTNINTVSTALHLSTDKVQLTFLAISQIFNKTKVQSEELVKQLGNLLPGAFASFVQANKLAGESTQEASLRIVKAMKAGTVAAHETIKNFTAFYAERFAGAFELARSGLNANLADMQTSFQLLGESIYNLSSGPLLAVVKGLGSFADGLRYLIDATGEVKTNINTGINIALGLLSGYLFTLITNSALAAKAIAGLRAAYVALNLTIDATIINLATIGPGLTAVSAATGAATLAMKGLNIAMSFLASPLIVITAIAAITKGIWDLQTATQDTAESIKKMNDTFDKLDAVKAAKKAGDKELEVKLLVEQDRLVVEAKENLIAVTERLQKLEASNRSYGVGQTKKEIELINRKAEATRALQRATIFATDSINASKLAEAENAKNFKNLQLGNPEADVTKGANVVTSISRSMIKAIESEAKAALERLQTKQDEINNKIELRQISAIDAYKEQLRLNKEILAVKLQQADKEIAAIQGRAPLREASQGTKVATPQFEGALKQYTSAINAAADKWKVPAEYIHAVMSKENASGKLDAVGKNIRNGQVVSRDLGLMQINDKAHPQYDANKLLTNAAYNIDAGTKILSDSLKAFPGDLVKGFAAYNAGIGGARKGVSTEYGVDVSKRAGQSIKQVSQGVTDVVDITTQLDAKERALEEDKQATKEAEKQLALRQKELTTLGQVIEVDFLRAKGLRDQADTLELNNKYRVQEELLGINGLEVEKAKIIHIKSSEALQLNLNRISERRTVAEQAYKDKVQETNTLLNAGVLSQKEAANLLNGSKKEYLALQYAEIKKLQEIIALNNSNLEAQDSLNNIKRSKEGEVAQGLAGLNSTIQSGLPSEFGFIQQAETDASNNANNKDLADTANKQLYANKLITHEEFLNTKAALEEKYAAATTVAQLKLYSGMAGVTATSLQSLSEVMSDVYGKNSKQAQAAFIAHKAMAVLQAGINVAQGVTKAISQGGIAGIATGSLVAASGAVQIAKIIATPMPQAHAGLTNVPEDQTYLLKKNERVLAPQQNKDLTNALQNGTMGGKQVVNNKIINVLDPSIVGDYLTTSEGENLVMNIVSKNKAA